MLQFFVRNRWAKKTLVIYLSIAIFFMAPVFKTNEARADGGVSLATLITATAILGAAISGVKYFVTHNSLTGIQWTLSGQIAAVVAGAASSITTAYLLCLGNTAVFETYQATEQGVQASIQAVLDPIISSALSGISQFGAISISYLKERLETVHTSIQNVVQQDINNITAHSGQQPPSGVKFDDIWADFNTPSITSQGMTVTTTGMEYNDYYGGSWRMVSPGISRLRCDFNVSSLPSQVAFELVHLTSGDSSSPGGGYSPVDIYVNGQLFKDNYDVAQNHNGSHSFEKDSWDIASFLHIGANQIIIELNNDPFAFTHYWLQGITIRPMATATLAPTISITDSLGTQNDNMMNFGNTPVGSQTSANFTIANSGVIPLVITSWTSTSSAFSLSPVNLTGSTDDVTRQPGESTTVQVTFSPSGITNYSGTITITSNDPANPMCSLTVTGTGVPNQSGITLAANPTSIPLNGITTLSATVRDGYGNPVGAGKWVYFITGSSGQWGSYDHMSGVACYQKTNSQGVATVTWTSGEVINASFVATSDDGDTDSTSVNVTAPSLSFTVSCTKTGGNDTESYYYLDGKVADIQGTAISNEDVYFQTTKGTITDPAPPNHGHTGLSGSFHASISTTEGGQATITVTVLGTSYSIPVIFQVGPTPSIPTGKYVDVGLGGLMDLSADGQRLAIANGSTFGVYELASGRLTTASFGSIPGTIKGPVNGISTNSNGTKIGVTIDYRQRGVLTYDGTALTGNFPVTPLDSNINWGVTSSWLGNYLLFGHTVSSTKPYQFTLYDNNAGLLQSLIVNSNDLVDIPSHGLAARPGTTNQFAAVSKGDPDQGLNFVYYGTASGSINIINSFRTSFKNMGVAWNSGGTKLVVGCQFSSSPLSVYDANALSSGSPTPLTNLTVDVPGELITFTSDNQYMAVAGSNSSGGIRIFQTSGPPSSWYLIGKVPQITPTMLRWLPNTHILMVGGIGNGFRYIYPDDVTPPEVIISSPQNNYQTAALSVPVTGRITDANGIQLAQIRNNGGDWNNLTLDASGNFTTSISLAVDNNTIDVQGTDSAGWVNTRSISVKRIVDTVGPIITNGKIAPMGVVRPGCSIEISAKIIDGFSGVNESTVLAHIQKPDETDVATVALIRGSNDTFTGTWDTATFSSGTYNIDITASDNSSNPSEAENIASPILNVAPIVSLSYPASDVILYRGDTCPLQFSAPDPDSNATLSLYLDMDHDAASGRIPIPGGIGLTEETTSLTFDTSTVSAGDYYVYLVASDEGGNTGIWSTGKLIIRNKSMVQGQITLKDFLGDVSSIPLTADFQNVDNPALTENHTIHLLTDGSYSLLSSLLGNCKLSVKGPHWLRKTMSRTLASGTTTANFDLTNGDSDGDNEITSTDLSMVLAAMDSSPGSPNWNANADLNGDNLVSNADMELILNTMDMKGEEGVVSLSISATASTDNETIVFGQSSTLHGSASGGLAPYSYSWSAGNWSSNEQNPSIIPTRTATYTLTVTDSSSPALSATGTVTINVGNTGTIPERRFFAPMCYDSERQVTTLFGGAVQDNSNETWEWNGSSWLQRSAVGPSPRSSAGMAYDSLRKVTVLFGGYSGGAANGETWEWDGSTWTQKLVNGPSPRYYNAMAFDSHRNVVVLFGGKTNVQNNETWEWDGSTWTQKQVSGPSARSGTAMAFDSLRNVTVLFGGDTGSNNGDTWEWDGTVWTQKSSSGPSPRSEHAMAFDRDRGVTVLFGGYIGHSCDNKTWEWDGSTWTQKSSTGPSSRSRHGMAYDQASKRVVMFGGYLDGFWGLNDTWEWDGTSWTQK